MKFLKKQLAANPSSRISFFIYNHFKNLKNKSPAEATEGYESFHKMNVYIFWYMKNVFY